MVVDTRAFNPEVPPFDLSPYLTNQKYFPGIPIIGCIGKITYHFETKGLCELLEVCSGIKEDFLLLFVANGKKLDQFKRLVRNANLNDKTIFLDFFPPWQIPSILKRCTCVVELEKESSPVYHYHISSIPYEALATGTCVLISDAMHKKDPYRKLIDDREILVVDPTNAMEFRKQLMKVIENPDLAKNMGINGCKAMINHLNFNSYIEDTIHLYKSILNNN